MPSSLQRLRIDRDKACVQPWLPAGDRHAAARIFIEEACPGAPQPSPLRRSSPARSFPAHRNSRRPHTLRLCDIGHEGGGVRRHVVRAPGGADADAFPAADASVGRVLQFTVRMAPLGVVAPETPHGAPFDEHRGPNARPVMNGRTAGYERRDPCSKSLWGW